MTEENNKNKKGRGREKGVSNINEKENLKESLKGKSDKKPQKDIRKNTKVASKGQTIKIKRYR